MKTILFLTIFLFSFFTCAAPELSSEIRAINREKGIAEYWRKIHEAEFDRFAEHLRSKESPDWTVINKIGCMGWFQFAPATLKWLGHGYITPDRFKANPNIFLPELQLKLLKTLVKCNEIELKDYMEFVGETINGILITKSGLLAGAHLGGAMGVKLYLASRGRVNKADIFHTSIQDYIREFQGYNI